MSEHVDPLEDFHKRYPPPKQIRLPGGMIVPDLTREEQTERITALMDALMADESGYDEETWPELKARLDRYDRNEITVTGTFQDGAVYPHSVPSGIENGAEVEVVFILPK